MSSACSSDFRPVKEEKKIQEERKILEEKIKEEKKVQEEKKLKEEEEKKIKACCFAQHQQFARFASNQLKHFLAKHDCFLCKERQERLMKEELEKQKKQNNERLRDRDSFLIFYHSKVRSEVYVFRGSLRAVYTDFGFFSFSGRCPQRPLHHLCQLVQC